MDQTPLYVPIVFAAWGVICWFGGFRNLLRDPEQEIRKMARQRSRSRLLRMMGAQDEDSEFEDLWRSRWIAYAVGLFYVVFVMVMFVTAVAQM